MSPKIIAANVSVDLLNISKAAWKLDCTGCYGWNVTPHLRDAAVDLAAAIVAVRNNIWVENGIHNAQAAVLYTTCALKAHIILILLQG